jgi:hypothetical protein
MLLFHQWKLLSRRVTLSVIGAIVVIAFACSFHTPPAVGGWDRASLHIVTADVFDVRDNYCYTVGYSYYIADTTTQHYLKYHVGPDWATPDDHPFPHTGTITETVKYKIDRDLDTLCDGTDPNDTYYLAGS